MNNSAWKDLIRPGILLLLIVVGCAIAARFLSGQETLEEYARKNPEIAYGRSTEDETGETGEEERVQPQMTDRRPPGAEETPDIGEGLPADVILNGEESAGVTDPGADAVIIRNDTGALENGAPDTGAAEPGAPDTGAPENGALQTDAPLIFGDGGQPAAETDGSAVDDSDVRDRRVTLRDGFFHEPIPDTVRRRMNGVSYPEDCPVSLDALRYLNIRYVDFSDTDQSGEIVCGAEIAEDLLEIFIDLYDARYQLQSVRLVDDFGGDDDASMLANNTSCFNYRTVAGSTSLSRHATGMAIDINPFYNPWVNHGQVDPPEAAEYADRTRDFPHKIDESDYCYQCFINHGFFWGGAWNNPDYQHFQRN